MGVDIIVKDAMINDEKITFDQTLSQLDFSITDFRKSGMKWYFYDFNDKFHSDELRSQFVTPVELISGANKIMDDVSEELLMDLNNNPIKAYQELKEILDEKLRILDQIIVKLQYYHERRKIYGAGKYLDKVKQMNYLDSFINIDAVIHYVELAVFFFVCGTNGHSIEWSY